MHNVHMVKSKNYQGRENWLLTLPRRRETQLPCFWPLAIWTISCIGLPADKMSHWLLNRSSLKKSNSLCCVTGIQTEVAALNTMPEGSPGSSKFFRVITLTSSPTFPRRRLSHLWVVEAQTPEQKLSVIRCANFNMLLLPARLIAADGMCIRIWKFTKFIEVKEWSGSEDKDLCDLHWGRLMTWGLPRTQIAFGGWQSTSVHQSPSQY